MVSGTAACGIGCEGPGRWRSGSGTGVTRADEDDSPSRSCATGRLRGFDDDPPASGIRVRFPNVDRVDASPPDRMAARVREYPELGEVETTKSNLCCGASISIQSGSPGEVKNIVRGRFKDSARTVVAYRESASQ